MFARKKKTQDAEAAAGAEVSDGEAVPAAPPAKRVPYLTLYRYATVKDRLLMLVGLLGAMVTGVSQPLMTIVFADVLSSITDYAYNPDKDRFNDRVRTGVIYLLIIGAAVFLASYLQMCLWTWAGENQARRIREEYLKAVLRQDIAWFDKTPTGDITTRLSADIGTIQEGISEKVSQVLQASTTFVAGFVIAFVKGWQLALVLCSVFPILAGASMLMARAIGTRTGQGVDHYADAGAIAQEVISSIRTVASFGGESRDIKRYQEKLEKGEKTGIRIALINGASIGLVMFIIFSTYSLGFFYGGTLIGHGLTGQAVINVFFSIIIGAFSLGQVGPNLAAIGSAIGAAGKIFETIDRQSPIDAFSDAGIKLTKVKGAVSFKNIDFNYPQRPDVPILKNFSLDIASGSTVALVGASGSGKSTIVKLLERFYDPQAGKVEVDGVDIKDINVASLRQQIGFVGQEPVLFDQTVRENILNGLVDASKYTDAELDAKVRAACEMANAWDFVQLLPEGLDTPVGEAGGMMSGGQKQRIAIARAIIRDPKILLLDEATSALDTASERVVQAALDRAAADRTTIVIAHRLSTIKNADLIVVMRDGEIVEVGRHNDLIANEDGIYASLVRTQALRQKEDVDAAQQVEDATHSKATLAHDITEAPVADSGKGEVAIEMGDMGRRGSRAGSVKSGSASAFSSGAKRRKKVVDAKQLEEEKAKEEEKEKLKVKLPWARIWKINQTEWPLFVVGFLCSGSNGVLFPLFSIIFSQILTVFADPVDETRNSGIHFWALMFFLLAVGSFFSNLGSIAAFGTAGEKLTKRLRLMSFTSILNQDIAFFDEPRHTTGALTARLAEDANLVQGLTGRLTGSIVQTVVTAVAGLVIAFVHGWELTLIVLGVVPFIAVAGAMQIRVLAGFGSKTKEAYNESAEIANEAIDQIRTVATLTKEKAFLENYQKDIVGPHAIGVRGAFVGALGFGIGQGVIFLAYAVAFYSGSQLMIIGRSDAQNVLTVMFAVIFTAISAGQSFSFAPNYVKAKLAALSVIELLDRVPAIDRFKQGGFKAQTRTGEVAIKDAVFRYPSRPDVPVLTGLDVAVKPGTTVALVGPSGCGKSTSIAIVERWYDLLEGKAVVDGADVREWDLTSLREGMALVGQEPVLFNLSVRENIAYGFPSGAASHEEIERAARMANVHDFVSALPDGYNTIVGGKGGQLSGGQKQRVAIARALVRDPRLLLLDEATSALDSESERVVQDALDAAARGRTTIVIAHRLATVQRADVIAVIGGGKVVEMGSYDDLVRLGGKFAELVAAQGLGKVTEEK